MNVFRRRRRTSLPRRQRLPQIQSLTTQRGRRSGATIWTLVAVAMGLLALIVMAPYWLPAVRWVVPDRYIMAYVPPSLQRFIFEIDVNEQVPTPIAEPDQGAALRLLDTPAVPPTPILVTATPSTGLTGGGSYVQPTAAPVAPTPTVTPAAALGIDPSAVDLGNQADLSQVDALLTGFDFHQQTGSNNCGPASFATMISYWGVEMTLERARSFLKPDPDDPNVRPDEMVRLAESLGYHMVVRDNGNFEILKNFILAGYPVLIETGYDPEPETIGWTSHYLTLVGFSEADQGFIAMDTYRRPNWFYPYVELDTYWRQFNRRYLVAYRPDQTAAVASIIGADMDNTTMYQNAAFTAQFELSLNRSDPFGWFNLGTSLTGLGRYEDAAYAFDEARRIGLPWRMLWYQFAPFETYLQVGRYDDVIALADAVLQKIPTEEPLYYKAVALAAQGNLEEARSQLSNALHLNPNFDAARLELDRLGGS